MNIKKFLFKNIPNILTISRIILSFLLVLIVFLGARLLTIVIIFAIAALTDFFDGFLARKYKLETEIGRKMDIIADRILMLSLVIAIVAYFFINGLLTQTITLQLLMLISREIVAFPFVITAFIFGKVVLPDARKIGKLTTLLQGITFPIVLLGWSPAFFFAGATCVVGIASGIVYAKDSCFSK
jgi:CDP-diacylglycerol--glycerol-3-phosphate 3-phosphatidyltransferase